MKHNWIKITEIILILSWLITLKESDSFYIPYLITGIVAIVACTKRNKIGPQKNWTLSIIFSSIFTFFICAANHSLFSIDFSATQIVPSLISITSLVLGTFITFYNILVCASNLKSINYLKITKDKFYKLKPSTIFFISFAIISLAYILVLLCKYPGNLSVDSIRQITQNITGEYSNHHPFIHTIIIGLFINIGQNVFNNINIGVGLYSIFQILFMSSIFAYSLMTLYQKKVPKIIIITILLFFALCPYHIMYSITMWKDIPFGGFALLFVTSQYRIFYHIGRSWINYFFVGLSSCGLCLFRNNGFYAVAALLILFIIMFRREIFQTKKLLLNFSLVTLAILFTFIYNSFILRALNVTPSEPTESLSVPAQQVARTIRDHNLTSEQLDLLNNILDTEHIADIYTPGVSDPIKKQIFELSDQGTFLKTHKSELIKLYIELGISHPKTYFLAWADLTRGYYNSGYDHWVLTYDIQPNELGIERTKQQSVPNKLLDSYLLLFENNPILRIIYCIGFAVWSTIILLYIAITKKDKPNILLIALPLLIIATLLIATPVYSEFRYAYSLFCCLPFLSVATLFPKKDK